VPKRRDAVVRPVRALADRLRIEGADQLSQRLVQPLAETGTELVSAELVEALTTVAEASWVNPVSRTMANDLLRVVRDPVAVLGRCGVVYVVWDKGWEPPAPEVPSEPKGYSCSWQNHDAEDLDYYQGAEFPALDVALQWARHRSDHVLVRPQWDSGRHYLATDEPPERWRVRPGD
jgi:hypothetical protein